jgi:serine/threonine protein kinase
MSADSPTQADRQQRLEEAVAAYLRALDAGQAPDRRELLARYPDLAAELTEFFTDEDGLGAVLGPLRSRGWGPWTGSTEEFLPDPFPGEFRVVCELGEGAFGKVWLAEDLGLGRKVALKTLRPGEGLAEADRKLEALLHEAQTLAQFRHPNLVQVYALRKSGEEHFLVLQYVAGGSLARRLAEGGPLPWPKAARYVADVGEGLLAVHARGVVHRDIKPGNILWDSDRDEALLTDFGIAAHLAALGTPAGTPAYMSPEALRGQLTPALDVYSLAATLFELATGELPFRLPAGPDVGACLAELAGRIERGLPDPDPRCALLPGPLERLIRSGLAAPPERRPGLREFVCGLRGLVNQLLADTLSLPASVGPAPVSLRVLVSRRVGAGDYRAMAATHPPAEALTRDMKRVPPAPEQVSLRTGDRVRVEVVADRPGYLTVFNIGPTGNLNLLSPDEARAERPEAVEANQPVRVADVEVTPPAGRERLFAVWSRRPLPLRLDELHSLAAGGEADCSRAYLATRDMKRVQESVGGLAPEDWRAAVLELEHGEEGARPG